MNVSSSTPMEPGCALTFPQQPWASDSSWLVKLSQLPHVVRSREMRDDPSYKSPTPEETKAHMRASFYGLYDDTYNVNDNDCLDWEARKVACRISSSVVGIYRETSGYARLNSSGIILEIIGVKKILTSAYIVGEPSQDADHGTVDVLLPNREIIKGWISYVDKRHNIALINADLEGNDSATFQTELVDLGAEVVAVGRHKNFNLMASRGKINIRDDHLESDDLMSSSCNIAEWGIGGALIDSSGMVLGMNFFGLKCSTPFMPSGLLLRCVEHLLTHGRVIRPWLGLKIRSLNEVKVADLEMIYQKSRSTTGVIVKQVMEGSAAEEANICPGDIIISVNDIPISSAAQFGEEVFKMVESSGSMLRNRKMRARSVEVAIQRVTSGTTIHRSLRLRDFTPVSFDNWPVLPVPPVKKAVRPLWDNLRD